MTNARTPAEGERLAIDHRRIVERIGGLLDKPSEVCLRGKKIYVANIDLPFDNNEYDAPHTISVLKLK